jgi:uncharacterized protein YbjT (DUF2867 family)
MKKAILLGASGLIGGHILDLLLTDKRYDKVVAIGRKELQLANKKLKQVKGDLFNMSSFEAEFQDGDDLFIAIGTTQAKTPDKKKYEAIDYGIPVAAAELAVEKSIANVAVVSSMGADSKSKIFYSALKGKMENAISDLPIKNLNIVRPSLLLGDRNENRLGERMATFFMTNLSFLIPKKHKAIQGRDVAKAMIVLVNQEHEKIIWMNDELHELAR